MKTGCGLPRHPLRLTGYPELTRKYLFILTSGLQTTRSQLVSAARNRRVIGFSHFGSLFFYSKFCILLVPSALGLFMAVNLPPASAPAPRPFPPPTLISIP